MQLFGSAVDQLDPEKSNSLFGRANRRNYQGGVREPRHHNLLAEWRGSIPSDDKLMLASRNFTPYQWHRPKSFTIEVSDSTGRRALGIHGDGQKAYLQGE